MKFFHAFLVFIFVFQTSYADHITKSSMIYECLGNELYKVTMELSRDCNGSVASFDNSIEIGVMLGDNYFFTKDVNITTIENIAFSPYENCPIDNELYCYEKGSYIFEISLPLSTEKYTLFYARCCWTDEIDNLIEPSTYGVTVLTEILPFAQEECNSQESIDLFYSFPFCPNVEMKLELPLFDLEGDSLAIRLCFPYRGGGTDGGTTAGDPQWCTGLIPNPENCPPSYETVPLSSPFTEANPFPSLDGIDIDQVTGIVSFTPTIMGRYVYSICVDEYRNNQFLGSQKLNQGLIPAVLSSTSEFPIQKNEFSIVFQQNEFLVLESNDIHDIVNVELYSIDGMKVSENNFNSHSELRINTDRLVAGIYFIKIHSQQSYQTIKLFVY